MNGIIRRETLVIVLGAILLSACSNSTRNSSSRVLRIAEGTQPIAAPVYVANAKGYFKDEGLNVELVSFPTGKLCLDAVIGGKADFATAAETPIVNASFSNQPIKIVATFQRARENTYLVARKDRRIAKPADLKGKVVGVPVGTNAEFALSAFLAKNNVQIADLKLISLNPPEMIGPITRGDVAAIAAWEPHAGRSLRALKDNGMRFSFGDVYEETYNLVSSAKMASEETDTVAGILRALNRAIKFMTDNQPETVQIVSQRIGMEQSELATLWPIYHFGLDLRRSLEDVMASEGEFAIQGGQQKGPLPNMRDLLSTKALRAVQADAVDLP